MYAYASNQRRFSTANQVTPKRDWAPRVARSCLLQQATTLVPKTASRSVRADTAVETMLAIHKAALSSGADAQVAAQTWETTKTALKAIWESLDEYGFVLSKPRVESTDDGALHVMWKRQDHFIAIVVPADGGPADWFVRERGGEKNHNRLDPKALSPTLVTWLKR